MNTCTTCKYFHASSCHRYPPTVVSYTESEVKGSDGVYREAVDTYTRSEYPSVTADDWCGEWKDPNAVSRETNIFTGFMAAAREGKQ